MRKLIIGLALVVGCRSGATMASAPVGPEMPSGNVTGASNAHAAIDAFMGAVASEDLQAMGAIWGTANGPARSQMNSDDLQKRELTMICFLHHDSYQILTDAPTLDHLRTYTVTLKYKTLTHAGQFNVGRASDGRYYVFSVVNIGDFQDFCGAK